MNTIEELIKDIPTEDLEREISRRRRIKDDEIIKAKEFERIKLMKQLRYRLKLSGFGKRIIICRESDKYDFNLIFGFSNSRKWVNNLTFLQFTKVVPFSRYRLLNDDHVGSMAHIIINNCVSNPHRSKCSLLLNDGAFNTGRNSYGVSFLMLQNQWIRNARTS